MNWVVALLALAMFGLWTWLAAVAFRYDPPPSSDRDDRWVGIGGWLVLLAIVLALRPFLFGSELLNLAKAVSMDKWSDLTTYGSNHYNALWAPVLLFELAANSVQCVFSLLILRLFFQRRSSFPRAAILFLLAAPVLQVSDHMLASLLPITKTKSTDVARIMEAAIGMVAWSLYLALSRRVKATFVKRYHVSVPPPLPHAAARTNAGEPMIATATTEPD